MLESTQPNAVFGSSFEKCFCCHENTKPSVDATQNIDVALCSGPTLAETKGKK